MNDEAKSNCPAKYDDEPMATHSTVPMWLIALTLMLLFLGAVYFDHHSGWFNVKVYSPYVSAEQLEMYQPKSGAAAAAAQGKKVYETVCGICHGVDGMGKSIQAPPLVGSEWVNTKGVTRLIRIPQAGLNGLLQVEGKDWNLNMAPMGANLSDADLAAVLTYIRTSWGNQAGAVTAEDVKAARAAMGAHPTPLTGGELKNMPE
jgi:mono/diheme cytochrome c family protein